MRNDDVPGYATRTQAVYNCLARDFVEPQLKGPDGAGSVVVTLIEMQDDAEVVHVREPLTFKLVDQLKKRGRKRAKSHGNYLPALDNGSSCYVRTLGTKPAYCCSSSAMAHRATSIGWSASMA